MVLVEVGTFPGLPAPNAAEGVEALAVELPVLNWKGVLGCVGAVKAAKHVENQYVWAQVPHLLLEEPRGLPLPESCLRRECLPGPKRTLQKRLRTG